MRPTPSALLRLAVLAATAAAALAFVRAEEQAGAIDLTDQWTVAVEGGVTLTCTATVEQAGTDLDAELRCPGVFPTPLEGDVDVQTRVVFLDLRGEFGLDVELHGTVSEDGNKVEGTWQWSAERLTGTFQAVRGVEPPTVPNLDGTWTLEVGIDNPVICPAAVEQAGTDVQLEFQCEGFAAAVLTGEIDNRQLTLTGDPPITVLAAVSPDGLAFGGTWYDGAAGVEGAALTGLKNVPHAFVGDVIGDWSVAITGGLFGDCDVAVDQQGAAIFAAFDCGPAGGWWLRGAIDPVAATFTLSGMAGSLRDYDTRIRGALGEDGESFTAAFAAQRQQSGSGGGGGTLNGERIDDSPGFLNAEGGYDVLLVSRLGERIVCEIEIEQTQEVLLSEVDCAGVGLGSLDGWISPLTGAFELTGNVGAVELTLEGTASTDGGLQGEWRSDRRFVDGCFTTNGDDVCDPFQRVPGDANCDGRTNSVDAALVLQVAAGFLGIDDIPCSSNVYDLRLQCCPVVINALDAAIILQLNAGLFGRLWG